MHVIYAVYIVNMSEVRRIRESAGLSQAELAQRVGLSQPNISAYESGARNPSKETVRRIRSAGRRRPSVVLAEHRGDIRRLAAEHKAHDVRVFGSASRGQDTPDSDLDLLVKFDTDASLLDLVGLADALEDCLGVSVDVVSEDALNDRNRTIRHDAVPV